MKCSEVELNDYALRELPEPERVRVEAHVRECGACRSELDRLLLTEAALFSLRDEEVPQRIAFVSDQVFEPSPMRRWFGAFWGSAARLGFASAAILSAAILYSALTRPTPRAVYVAPAPMAKSSAPSGPDVQQLIQTAVEKAVRESEKRQARKTEETLTRLARQTEQERKELALAQQQNRYWERQNGAISLDAAGYRREARQ